MTNVIVIDDESDVSEVLCEFLKIKGINVVGRGTNGRDAINLYAQLKPDLVLMDLVMPDFDGFYGIKKIRNIDSHAKIIIVSASLTHYYVDKLIEMNVSAISLKPYDFNHLIELINKVNDGIPVQKIPTKFSKNN